MKAWNYEAGQITLDDDPKLEDIVINDEITEFINPNKKNNKFFVVAPKGLGKTLILKVLRMRYHSIKNGVTYIPENELCEKVSISMFSIRKEEIASFSDQNHWKDIWKYTIVLSILVRLGLDIDDVFKKKLKKANNISSILNIILDDYKFFLFRNKDIFSSVLMPQIRDINQHIALFIDSFDQAIEELFKYQNFDFSNPKEKKDAFDLWANSQLGLMYAINDICQQQRHIKIFTAIREEALSTDKSTINLQINDYVTRISYTKKELEEIFLKNISKTDNTKLCKPTDDNPYIKFLGLDAISHAIVRKKKENVFDFIFRHTFGRPRELVLIGARLSQIAISERTETIIRQIVNKSSNEEIFKQFKQEIVPFFDEEEFKEHFLNLIRENVFSKEEATILPNYLFKYYSEIGLVGGLRKDHVNHGKYVQSFELSYNRTFQDQKVPISDYYFLHPATDKLFMSLGKKYNQHNIIGYNYEFSMPKVRVNSTTSICHFGVGKLGIGLVIPIITQLSKKILIVNRYSDNWQSFSLKNEIDFLDTNMNLNTFCFLNDDTPDEIQLEIIEEWNNSEDMKLFIASDNKDLIINLMDNVKHITLSLKSENGIDWLNKILKKRYVNKPYTLYPFENSKEIVSKLYQSSNNSNMFKSYLIADRVCTSLDFNPTEGKVHCLSECYGQVTIFSDNTNNLFAKSPQINGIEYLYCETKESFDFFYNKKFRLLNCVHACIAIYCYSRLAEKKIPLTDWGNQYLNVLQDLDDIKYRTGLIVKAEILRLIKETDRKLIDEIYLYHDDKEVFQDLYDYSKKVAERISSMPDKLERVLPINDFTRKYRERVKDLYNFYDDQDNYTQIKAMNILTNEEEYREIRKNINSLNQVMLDLLTIILDQRKGITK